MLIPGWMRGASPGALTDAVYVPGANPVRVYVPAVPDTVVAVFVPETTWMMAPATGPLVSFTVPASVPPVANVTETAVEPVDTATCFRSGMSPAASTSTVYVPGTSVAKRAEPVAAVEVFSGPALSAPEPAESSAVAPATGPSGPVTLSTTEAVPPTNVTVVVVPSDTAMPGCAAGPKPAPDAVKVNVPAAVSCRAYFPLALVRVVSIAPFGSSALTNTPACGAASAPVTLPVTVATGTVSTTLAVRCVGVIDTASPTVVPFTRTVYSPGTSVVNWMTPVALTALFTLCTMLKRVCSEGVGTSTTDAVGRAALFGPTTVTVIEPHPDNAMF